MIKNKCLRHIYCSVVKIKYSVISVTHYLINMIRYGIVSTGGINTGKCSFVWKHFSCTKGTSLK